MWCETSTLVSAMLHFDRIFSHISLVSPRMDSCMPNGMATMQPLGVLFSFRVELVDGDDCFSPLHLYNSEGGG